jgi:hypothetical protein
MADVEKNDGLIIGSGSGESDTSGSAEAKQGLGMRSLRSARISVIFRSEAEINGGRSPTWMLFHTFIQNLQRC